MGGGQHRGPLPWGTSYGSPLVAVGILCQRPGGACRLLYGWPVSPRTRARGVAVGGGCFPWGGRPDRCPGAFPSGRHGDPLWWGLGGGGMGLLMAPLRISVTPTVPRSQLGVASSVTMFSRTVGGAIGV